MSKISDTRVSDYPIFSEMEWSIFFIGWINVFLVGDSEFIHQIRVIFFHRNGVNTVYWVRSNGLFWSTQISPKIQRTGKFFKAIAQIHQIKQHKPEKKIFIKNIFFNANNRLFVKRMQLLFSKFFKEIILDFFFFFLILHTKKRLYTNFHENLSYFRYPTACLNKGPFLRV